MPPYLKTFVFLLALVLFAFASRAGNKVTINSDNVLVVNGEKVFPIGFTTGPPPGAKAPNGKEGLRELSDAGGFFMRTGANGHNWNEETFAEEQQWEDAAARCGMYCWLYLHDLASIREGDTKREAMLRRVIDQFKDHPGLGIWKGADEPQWGKMKVEPLARAYNIVRELDPNHPFVTMEAPRGTVKKLRPYNATCDVTGMDVYPIGYPPGKHSLLQNKDINMVGDYTRMMMDVTEGKKPVWMVLQIAWSGVVQPGKTLRFPTFPEERFMTYEAIINGSRGLLYFGGNVQKAMTADDAALGWNWTFWNRVLKPVVEEIGRHSRLEPALVAPESKLPIAVSDRKDIEFCVREVGDEIFLLACRRSGEIAQVEFSKLPVADGTYQLMYEEPRSVNVAGGKFKDWFAPYEVHVYRMKRSS